MNKNRVYNTKRNKLASVSSSRFGSNKIRKPFIIGFITLIALILISLFLLYQEQIVGKAFEVARVSAGVPRNLPPFSNNAQINIPVRANIGNAKTTAIRFVMSIKRSNGNLILCSDADAPTLVNLLPWGQASSAATPHDAGMAATTTNPLATSISRIVCSGTQWTFEYATLNFGQAQPSTPGQIDIAQFQFSACLAPGTYTFSASEFTIVDNQNPPVTLSQPAPVVVIPIVATEDTTVIVNAAGSCPAAPACIPLQGLVSEWSGESLVGTQLGDRVGGNIGTAIGVVTRVTDNIVPRGQVLNFGGTDADYVRVPDSPSLQITGDFSVGAWIKTSSPKPIQAILSKVTTSPVQEGYILALGDNQGQRNDGKPCLWLSSDAGWVCGTRVINDGNWYHVVAVRQGALISIFVDGVLSNSGNKPVRANFLTNNEILKIGGSTPGQLREFVGRIDEAIYVNRALTDAEIQRIYRSGVCVSCTSRPSTACTQGVDCPGSTVISATGCTIAGQTCQGTPLTCQCPAGQILCGAVPNQRCVNTQTDNSNCGACGNACAVGQRCGGGICSCTRNSECRNPTPICASYLCRSCTSGECGVGLTCVSGSCVAAAPPAPSCASVGTTNSQNIPCPGAAIPAAVNTARVLVASCPASPAACTYLCNTGLVPNAAGTSCVARGAVTFGINPTSSTGQTVSTGQTINVDVHMDISGTGLVSRVGFTLTAAGDAALDGASAVKGAVVIDPTQTLRCINKDNNPKQVACQISGLSGTTSSGVIVKIPGKIGSLATGSITFELSSLSATDNRGTDLTAANGGTRTLTVALPACPAGQTRCGNVCVNLQTDNSNCGACGNACTVAGQTCQGTPPSCRLAPPAPSCAPVGTTNSQTTPCLPAVAPTVSNTRRVLVASCPASPAACTYLCNTGLVPNADGTSCVSCASVVPANSQTGLCPGAAIPAAANTARVLVPSCPVDPLPNSVAACTYPCNRGFVPNADRTSCVAGGACGAANAACTRPCFTGSTCDPIGAVCQGGTLQPAGTACTLAGGAGSCNAAGACIVTCPAGQILCGAVPNQRCVNTQTDAANCGACGTACPVGQSCRGGLCALASCGNGQLDINEECDLSVVSTAGRFTINSCAGVNNRFTGGTLGCRANCLYDTSICTSPPPPPPASSGGGGGGGGGHCVAEWQCTPWSYCNKELKQTRTCTDVDPRCSNRPKTETRDCPACEVSWTCGLYSQCINGQETRSCWDEHECGTAASRTPSPMPQLSKSCVIPVEPSSGGFLPPPPVFQPPVVQKLSPFQKYKVPIIVGGGAAAVGLPALFYLLFKRRKKKVYNLDELKGWIRKEREIGTSNNDIIQILKEQTGWNHKEIMGAFESLRQESLESESSPVQEVEEES